MAKGIPWRWTICVFNVQTYWLFFTCFFFSSQISMFSWWILFKYPVSFVSIATVQHFREMHDNRTFGQSRLTCSNSWLAPPPSQLYNIIHGSPCHKQKPREDIIKHHQYLWIPVITECCQKVPWYLLLCDCMLTDSKNTDESRKSRQTDESNRLFKLVQSGGGDFCVYCLKWFNKQEINFLSRF